LHDYLLSIDDYSTTTHLFFRGTAISRKGEGHKLSEEQRLAIQKALTDGHTRSMTQVAQELGFSWSTVRRIALEFGYPVLKVGCPELRAAASSRLKELWRTDAEFAAKSAAASSEALMRKWNDPEFAAKHAAAARDTMTRLTTDPEFRTANSERTKQRWAEYRERKAHSNAQSGNDKSGTIAAPETPQRQRRASGYKLARTSTPQK
jgi:hypothetical protein